MTSPPTNPRNVTFTTSQALALIIGVFTVCFPSGLYWQLGSSLFGQYPLVKVFAISGAGGILSFALYAGRKQRLIAGVLGLFGGIGAAGILLLYTRVFDRQTMWTSEIAIIQVAGAAPAMALLAYFARRDRSSDSK